MISALGIVRWKGANQGIYVIKVTTSYLVTLNKERIGIINTGVKTGVN